MFKGRGQTKSGNRADLLFEDASGQEMPSAIISRKDESISSKLEKLVKSEKSIKRKLLEYDRKYNLEDMEMAPADKDNLLLQENRPSQPFIDAEGDSAYKKPSFKKSKPRVDSSPKKSEEKKRLVGKYPDYLSPAVINSHGKRPQSSQSKGQKTSHHEEEPNKHNGIAKRIEERVKVGKVVESKKDSREPSERRTNSKDRIEQMSKNNKHSTEESNSKYTANGTAKKFFSNYNSAYGFDLLPKTINMKINPATKMLEIIEGSQSEKQNKSIIRTPTKTAAAPTIKTSSNHIPIQPPPVAPKRPISSYTSLCQGQLKMSRKSINSATQSEHNPTNQKRQTFGTIEAVESPKLCQIIKTLPETQEFKKNSPYEINSRLDLMQASWTILSCRELSSG